MGKRHKKKQFGNQVYPFGKPDVFITRNNKQYRRFVASRGRYYDALTGLHVTKSFVADVIDKSKKSKPLDDEDEDD